MARILAQGSFTTPSERNAPRSIRSEVQTDLPVLDEQAMLTERGTGQTFLMKLQLTKIDLKMIYQLLLVFQKVELLK